MNFLQCGKRGLRHAGQIFLHSFRYSDFLSHCFTLFLGDAGAAAALPCKNSDQRYSLIGFTPLCAIFTAISATAFTIQSKFAWPTEVISASGAGFKKSIA